MSCVILTVIFFFFFSSRRRHTRFDCDWSSDVCSSDLRPPQADAGIHTVFPTPQHPSYPSAHSCFSGAYSGVLAAAFPSERARVAAVAQEASLSRLYAGIHYRFDMEAGLALGRGAAALALAAGPRPPPPDAQAL